MATINDVSIFHNGKKIATAPTGEIAPPPAAHLTVEGATWIGYTGKPEGTDYLQKEVQVTATAAGKPYKGTFIVSGIKGGSTIKLTQL